MKQQLKATAHNAEFHGRILSQMALAVTHNRRKAGKTFPVLAEFVLRIAARRLEKVNKALLALVAREWPEKQNQPEPEPTEAPAQEDKTEIVEPNN